MKVDPQTLPADHPSRNAPLSKVDGEYKNKVKKDAGWSKVTNMKIGSVSYNGLAAIRNNPWIEHNHWQIEI